MCRLLHSLGTPGQPSQPCVRLLTPSPLTSHLQQLQGKTWERHCPGPPSCLCTHALEGPGCPPIATQRGLWARLYTVAFLFSATEQMRPLHKNPVWGRQPHLTPSVSLAPSQQCLLAGKQPPPHTHTGCHLRGRPRCHHRNIFLQCC